MKMFTAAMGEQRAAPAFDLDHILDERNEDRAGKAAPQCERGNRSARPCRADTAGDHCESRLIKHRGLRTAEKCENGVVEPKRVHL